MTTPEESPRTGFRLSLRSGPVVPLIGVCVGVIALSAAVTMGGGDSSGVSNDGGVTTLSADQPAPLPKSNTCELRVGNTVRQLTVPAARTLTQVAAVGMQVKAPEEMIARVLDVAGAKAGPGTTVTDALDMFTREDSAVPTEASLAQVQALSQPGALTCVYDAPAATSEAKGKTGLTPRADAMRQGVVDAFGKLAINGYGAKVKGNTPEAAGRAISVAVPEATPADTAAGWVLAHWLAARGADYKVDTIAFADRVWAPTSGWTSTDPAQPTATPAKPGRVYVSTTQGTAAAKPAKATTKKNKKKS